jgi:hypothetical protein
VAGRNPIGTTVASRTIEIESQAAVLITSRILFTLKSFIYPGSGARACIPISA